MTLFYFFKSNLIIMSMYTESLLKIFDYFSCNISKSANTSLLQRMKKKSSLFKGKLNMRVLSGLHIHITTLNTHY